MSLNPAYFKAPFIHRDDIWKQADSFRSKVWPSATIPIDVMDIVEFKLDLDIRPVSSLRADVDIDALLMGDWQTIAVDQGQYMDDRYANRLRYSIAHELGHYVLHRSIFEKIPRSTPEEWLAFMLGMPEGEYSWLEYHAYEFAGRFLVPPDELAKELEAVIALAEKSGVSREQLQDDANLSYLANGIARAFAISSDVIEKRLSREGLWPMG